MRRSTDIVSGIVRMRRYPLAAATNARPMPVLPDVGSMRTDLPGRDPSLLLERLDHRDADAVLHGVGGIEELELRRHGRAGRDAGGHAVQADERRAADEFRDVGCDLHVLPSAARAGTAGARLASVETGADVARQIE